MGKLAGCDRAAECDREDEMKFPWLTLRNINTAAHEAGTLSTQEPEAEQALADELVLLCEMLGAKVAAWADEIRRRNVA